MSGPIKPIAKAPAAFAGIVDKLNEVIAANPPLQAGAGISISDAKENRIISVALNYEEFTICDNGSPATVLLAVKRIE